MRIQFIAWFFIIFVSTIGLTWALEPSAARIVTGGGAVTETVFALGAGSRVVGTDLSSLFPVEQTAALPKVGYIRQLSAEGILSLHPNLIITNDDLGPPPVVQQLKESGIPLVIVPSGKTLTGAIDRIRTIGKILGKSTEAEKLISIIQTDLSAAKAYRAGKPAKAPRVLFIYARGIGTMMVAGAATEANEIITLAGGVNAVSVYNGYRPLTPEALSEVNPEVILLMDGGLQSLGGITGLGAIPGISATEAFRKGRIIHMEDLYLLGFGPRLGKAVYDLSVLLFK